MYRDLRRESGKMQEQADDIGSPDKDAAAGTGTGSQAEENGLDADVADVPDPDEDDLDDLDGTFI